MLSLSTLLANSQVKIWFEDFDISFYPKKCVDTLSFDIIKTEYKNTKLIVYLSDCKGKCSIKVIDKNGIVRLDGTYANSYDTLKKYSNAKVMGKGIKKYVYQVRVLEYFSPLRIGRWNFYSKKGKLEDTLEYSF